MSLTGAISFVLQALQVQTLRRASSPSLVLIFSVILFFYIYNKLNCNFKTQ